MPILRNSAQCWLFKSCVSLKKDKNIPAGISEVTVHTAGLEYLQPIKVLNLDATNSHKQWAGLMGILAQGVARPYVILFYTEA